MRDWYHLACFPSGILQIMPLLLPKKPYWKVLAVSCWQVCTLKQFVNSVLALKLNYSTAAKSGPWTYTPSTWTPRVYLTFLTPAQLALMLRLAQWLQCDFWACGIRLLAWLSQPHCCPRGQCASHVLPVSSHCTALQNHLHDHQGAIDSLSCCVR